MNTTTTPPDDRPDAEEMIAPHNRFRRTVDELPGLIRAVATGDVVRARALCRDVQQLADALHEHHRLEDEVLWPLLLQRVDAEQVVVLRAEEQHERLHELLARMTYLVAPFGAQAAAGDRDALADMMGELGIALREHLDDEERLVLPLVRRHITRREWVAMQVTNGRPDLASAPQ